MAYLASTPYTPPDVVVPRVALILDRLHPGWADRIDLGRLDLLLTPTCVLGQGVVAVQELLQQARVENPHSRFPLQVWATNAYSEVLGQVGTAYEFEFAARLPGGVFSDNDAYREVWKEAILSRQAAKDAAAVPELLAV